MIVPERRVDIPRNALVISEYTPDAPGHQFTVFAVHGSREDMGMWDRRQRDSCNSGATNLAGSMVTDFDRDIQNNLAHVGSLL